MKPGLYNAEIEQGSTFERAWTITTGNLDLSQYDSIRMKIRTMPGSKVIWDSEAENPGGSITIEGTNRIRLILDAETTKAFQFTEAGYDVELVTDGTPEKVDKPLKGKLILNKEYTR